MLISSEVMMIDSDHDEMNSSSIGSWPDEEMHLHCAEEPAKATDLQVGG